jgi:hypothetical protein
MPEGRQCLCCDEFFHPDPRSANRQRFCSKPVCQKASKTLSQQRWQAKGDNQKYWRGHDQADRVRTWRRNNPRYWKPRGQRRTLQDDCLPRDPLLLGLLSTLASSTLQDDIAATYQHLVRKGREVLRAIGSKGVAPGSKRT